jgi:hypothetical protein
VIRRTLRIGLLLGLLGAAGFALAKLLGQHGSEPRSTRPSGSGEPWPRLPSDPTTPAPPIGRLLPDPAAPAPAAAKGAKTWVEPTGTVCPTSHPVKAKLSSKIFHVPGGASYDRTTPDRCYADAEGAEADGLRPAKR